MIRIFSKDKSQPYQSLRNTITSTKYMLNNIWRIKDGKIYLFLKSFLSILTAVLPLISVWMPGLIINELTGERRANVLLAYIGITAGIPFIQSMIVSTLKVHLHTLRNHFVTTIKVNFVSHCADMDLETMENPDIQVLKERAEETTIDSLDTFEFLSGFISALISMIMCISIIFSLNLWILVLVIIVVVINYLSSRRVTQKSFPIDHELSKYNRFGWPVLNYFSNLQYAKEMRLYHLKDYFTKLYSDKRYESDKYAIQLFVYHRNSEWIGAITLLLQTAVLYGYFVYRVIQGELAIGDMTIYMGTISQFANSLTNVTRQYLNLSQLSLRVQELMKFMNIPLKNVHAGSRTPIFDGNSVIEFKNVSFKYPGSEKYALRNMNITIHGNEKLCIVGVNGSGKSTFIKLLTRLYAPSEGEILLNGININEYDYLQYNKLFSPVFQDFALYNISLRDNIIMTDKLDLARLNTIIEQSGLSSLVNHHKDGYDTVLYKWYDEEAIEPSGGEGQRIAIARARYHDKDIFILDEPTAALDPNAEYEIYTQFNQMITGKCAVLITHRLSAVQLADKVAVFDDGHMVEYGTHAQLYAEGGRYTEMFDKQAQFYRDSTKTSEEAET